MDLGLQDKVALVAASSAGLGLATAVELAREGAKVAICGRSQERLDRALAQIRQEVGEAAAVASFVADVTSEEAVNQLVAETVAHFGGLDILVTNAGGPPAGTFDSSDLAAWEKAVDLTMMSAVWLIRAALPHLRRSQAASILTVTSASAKQPITGLLLSNVLRPAVIGLTKTLSQELGPENIRVNSILPGWTATDRVKELMAYRARQNNSDEATEEGKITQNIALGRMGEPAEFGRVAAFLVSPAASYLTGVMVQVDGGGYKGLL